jgi:hypothetical protein
MRPLFIASTVKNCAALEMAAIVKLVSIGTTATLEAPSVVKKVKPLMIAESIRSALEVTTALQSLRIFPTTVKRIGLGFIES